MPQFWELDIISQCIRAALSPVSQGHSSHSPNHYERMFEGRRRYGHFNSVNVQRRIHAGGRVQVAVGFGGSAIVDSGRM